MGIPIGIIEAMPNLRSIRTTVMDSEKSLVNSALPAEEAQ